MGLGKDVIEVKDGVNKELGTIASIAKASVRNGRIVVQNGTPETSGTAYPVGPNVSHVTA